MLCYNGYYWAEGGNLILECSVRRTVISLWESLNCRLCNYRSSLRSNKVRGQEKRGRVWEHPALPSSRTSLANAVSLSDWTESDLDGTQSYTVPLPKGTADETWVGWALPHGSPRHETLIDGRRLLKEAWRNGSPKKNVISIYLPPCRGRMAFF